MVLVSGNICRQQTVSHQQVNYISVVERYQLEVSIGGVCQSSEEIAPQAEGKDAVRLGIFLLVMLAGPP